MDIRQIQAFVAIADTGSFSLAADALKTVQSNISTRITKLEEELGITLLDRRDGSVTADGAIVLERSRRILAEMDAVYDDVRAAKDTTSGTVTVGMIGTTGRWLAPHLMRNLLATLPLVQLRIIEGTNSLLEPQVAQGLIDIAILSEPISHPDVVATPFFTEDLVVITTSSSPLARHATISVTELAQHELLLPLAGTALRADIDAVCAQHGVTLRPRIELDGVRTLASLAFDGYGPAILPATTLSRHLVGAFVAVPIDELPPRRVSLATRKFGFPSAPVRAVRDLLMSSVSDPLLLPAGVHRA